MNFQKSMLLSTVLILAVSFSLACQRGADVAETEPDVGATAAAEIMGQDGQSWGRSL